MPLHFRITASLILGATLGLCAYFFKEHLPFLEYLGPWIAVPTGQLFLRLLFMMVIPLVSTALISSTAGMARSKNMKKIAVKALFLALSLAFCAAVISLFMVNTIKPGVNIEYIVQSSSSQSPIQELPQEETSIDSSCSTKTVIAPTPWTQKIVEVIPKNPFEAFSVAHDPAKGGSILSVIIFSILIGLTLAHCPKETSKPFLDLVNSVLDLSRRYLAKLMQYAPIAVTALVLSLIHI